MKELFVEYCVEISSSFERIVLDFSEFTAKMLSTSLLSHSHSSTDVLKQEVTQVLDILLDTKGFILTSLEILRKSPELSSFKIREFQRFLLEINELIECYEKFLDLDKNYFAQRLGVPSSQVLPFLIEEYCEKLLGDFSTNFGSFFEEEFKSLR